jgi:hypothetical protein
VEFLPKNELKILPGICKKEGLGVAGKADQVGEVGMRFPSAPPVGELGMKFPSTPVGLSWFKFPSTPVGLSWFKLPLTLEIEFAKLFLELEFELVLRLTGLNREELKILLKDCNIGINCLNIAKNWGRTFAKLLICWFWLIPPLGRGLEGVVGCTLLSVASP